MKARVAQRFFEEAGLDYERKDSPMNKICSGLAQLAESLQEIEERLKRLELIEREKQGLLR